MDDVEITFRRQTFFPGFYDQSVFQEDGGPAVDEAWRTLGVDYPEMIVSPEEGKAAGLEGRIRQTASEGGGYPALMESMHQLHCLVCIPIEI